LKNLVTIFNALVQRWLAAGAARAALRLDDPVRLRDIVVTPGRIFLKG